MKGIIFVLIYTALISSLLFSTVPLSDSRIVTSETYSQLFSADPLPDNGIVTTGTHSKVYNYIINRGSQVNPGMTRGDIQRIQLILVILLILCWLTGIIDTYIYHKDMKSLHIFFLNKIRAVWISVVFSISMAVVIILIAWPKVFVQSVENVEANINQNLIKPTYTKTESQEAKVTNPESQENTLQTSSTEQKPESQEGITSKMKTTPMSDIDGEKRTISSRIEGHVNVEEDNKSSSASNFYVQVGAFLEKKRAQNVSQQLKEKGYSATIISPLTGENRKLYKVRIGSYRSRKEAQKFAKELSSKLGISVMVIK
jgi:cell division septation protein DedD